MSTVRQKMTAVNKAVWKSEEEKLNGNKQIVHENANIDIDKIAKAADKEAKAVLKKATAEVKAKAKKSSSKKSKSKKD
jgi:hypothetical protein